MIGTSLSVISKSSARLPSSIKEEAVNVLHTFYIFNNFSINIIYNIQFLLILFLYIIIIIINLSLNLYLFIIITNTHHSKLKLLKYNLISFC